MPSRRSVVFVCLIAVLFFIANRAAYQGYFSGDDLDNIYQTSRASAGVFARGVVTPIFNPDNFRPVGHAFYWLMGAVAGLRFAPYLAAVQVLHGVVTLLIFVLARKLGAATSAAAIGALFFVFHMALFDAFWKPMYVFDVFCALFAYLSVLAWLRSGNDWRWCVVSFVCFWLAYKSKEVAVMLPAVLFLLEYRGSRQWLRLAPFFAVSLSFGIQALVSNQSGAYHLALTPQTFAATADFYASHAMLRKVGLLALLTIVGLARDRFGAVAGLLFLLPMLALPGRLSPAYLYVPLAFVALLVASAAERAPKLASLALAVWLAFNFVEMRHLRSDALAEARQSHDYVATLERNRAELMRAPGIRFDGYPRALNVWGSEAAVSLVANREKLDRSSPDALTLSWQPGEGRLYLFDDRLVDDRLVSYLDMSTGTPIGVAYAGGWYEPERDLRWSKPEARLRLLRPATATSFEWKIFVPAAQLKAAHGKVTLEALIGGQPIGHFVLEAIGWQTLEAKLLVASPGAVDVELRVAPSFRPDADGRELGIAVGGIGFK